MARMAPPQPFAEEAVGLEPTRELPLAVFETAAVRPKLGLRFQVLNQALHSKPQARAPYACSFAWLCRIWPGLYPSPAYTSPGDSPHLGPGSERSERDSNPRGVSPLRASNAVR